MVRDPILTAIARHRAAWDAFQVAPEGDLSLVADAAMSDALDRPPDMSLTEYTGKAIKEFKRLARSLDTHVIVVAHPTKLTGGERPSLYSISDSAHWANKPDIGIVVWKESPEQDFAEIKVAKSRYHDQIGKPGTAHVVYMPTERRFHRNERHQGEAA